MADPRTFVLIGNFTDNITPSLEKINKSVDKLKNNLVSLSSVTKPLKNDFKSLSALSQNFSNSLKNQSSDLAKATAALKAYRSEMGRVNRAQRAGGGRIPPPGGGGVGRGGRGSAAAAVGGGVAGMQIGNMMTGAIVKGFQIGTSLMMKPFQYGATAFAERIRDEMTDIQSAGGLFATDQRKNLGLFKSFQDARKAQEQINYDLAKSAAALPGSTAQYVQEAKKVTDTMIGAMAKQPKEFEKFGVELGAKQGDKMDALSKVIQKFTEKAVLLGKGSGGRSSMYGMPQLLEMMVNMPQVNVQGMQKFAVLRGNPMLQAALQEAQGEINKTGMGTADRLRAIMKVLDEALPNEVIVGMKNSMDGIIEVIKSSFLDPEVGLFGLGRKFKEMGPKVDQFGRYIGENGQIVEKLSEAAKEDLSMFALIRDILGGFALPLSELAQILPEIFDPLRSVGDSLVNFRSVAQRFYANFNQYTADFEAIAKEMGGKEGAKLKRTAGARGALMSVTNLLRGIGAIDMKKYGNVKDMLVKTDANLGAITSDLLKTLMSSDFMKTIGETIGGFVGSAVKMVGDMLEGVTDFANAGPFAKGLKKGWEAAKGSLGVSKVFSSLFKIIGSVLTAAFKAAPFETSLLAALTVGMPLLSGALSAGITALMEKALAGTVITGAAGGGGAAAFARLLGPIGAVVTALVLFEGGLGNATRQLGEGLETSVNSLGGVFDSLGVVIGRVTGKSGDLSGNFDLIGAAMLPVTATFDLLEMSVRLIIEGWDNLIVQFYRFGGWLANQSWLKGAYSDEDRARMAAGQKEAESRLAASTAARNLARHLDDIYYTSTRYEGKGGYGKALQQDIASKQAKRAGLTKGTEEYKKINDELFSLRTKLALIQGSSPAATPAQLPPGVTPAAPGVGAAANPGVVGIQQINQKATAQVAHAASIKTSTAATNKNTLTANTALNGVRSGVISVSNKITGLQSALLSSLNNIRAGVQSMSSLLASGNLKVKTDSPGFPGFPGGLPMGGATGNLGAAQSLASQSGLTTTSFFRPGDKGMHGLGRAMDFSNGVNTPEQMAYAQQMIARYGSSIAELIYTPLGFGIKNGQKVPLSYWGEKTNAMHYNHVHVAFAEGKENGKMFSSQEAAGGWENSMVPGSVKIASVTANSGDGGGFGALTIGDINLTVNAGNVSDPDQLASIVALKIGEAVADARAASIFV